MNISKRLSFIQWNFNLKPALAWIAILGFLLITALCIVTHLGNILMYAFPAMAFAVGVLLYWKYPVLYFGFTWWIYFLTPWIRRLIDYQSGWHEPSIVLLTPYFVTLITFVTFLRYLPQARYQYNLPFFLACLVGFYGTLIGLILNPFTSVVQASLNWLSPVLFSFHLIINWRYYPKYQKNIQRVFVWGVFIMGVYGIIQFLAVPEWDRFWMQNAPIDSIGAPAPFKVRVYSTMNAPGPFADILLAGLILLFNHRGFLQFPTVGLGYLVFLLSLVRSAWLGWLAAMISFSISLKASLQIKIILIALVMIMCIFPLITLEPFSDVIQSRLETLVDPENDVSYNARTSGYAEVLAQALAQTSGKGLGFVLEGVSIGPRDSAFLDIFFSVGWFGAIPYLGAIFGLVFYLLKCTTVRFDTFASSARAICFGMVAQLWFGSVHFGVTGMVLWNFAALALASQQHYEHQQKLQIHSSSKELPLS
jgi:hypothetical protein